MHQLRILPQFTLGSRRSLRVTERNFFIYRRKWGMLVSGFFEPLFFLLSLGVGLNHLVGTLHVGGQEISYATFVAPGMMASSAMNGAVIDALFNTFWRLKIERIYDPILTTPLSVGDVALGEVIWAMIRGALYAASFLVCMVVLGDVTSPWAILCFPGALLTGFAFACVGLAACTWLRSWQDFDTAAAIQMPIFLFSATFFPITLYPGWLQVIVTCSPLYQSAALLRACALGQLGWSSLAHVIYLVVMALVGLRVAASRFTKILTP